MSERVDDCARIENGLLSGASFLNDAGLKRVLGALDGAGEEARVIGGAVRNSLLGERVHDVDLATTATPDMIIARAKQAGLRAVPTASITSRATSISAKLAIPVDIITGNLVEAIFSNNSISVIEADGILITGCFIFTIKSTLSTSQGDAKRWTFNLVAKSANS